MARPHEICALFLLVGALTSEIAAQSLPDTITVTIKNGDNLIKLNWQKTEQYVANHNMPIWKAHRHRPPQLMPTFMEAVDGFTMYQDIEKSAAVVYFKKSNSFFGLIDTRICIDGLPLNEFLTTEIFEVGGPYLKLRTKESSMTFHDEVPSPLVPSPGSPMDLSPPMPTYIDDGHSDLLSQSTEMNESNQDNKILYAEILVLVTNDVVEHYMKDGRTLMSLIAHYLIHFNAVDMLYAKLSKYGINIKINIAGIVLEADRIAFPYVNVFVPEKAELWHIIAEITIFAFQDYLRKYENVFPRDSYDIFFVSTDYGIQHNSNELSGISISKKNMYEDRLEGFHAPLGVLVTRQTFSAEFIASAHELAHTMNVEHDSLYSGRHCDDVQCYAILQEVGSFCRNCISWSSRSIKGFQDFISTNKGHCFFLNKPRSLHRHGLPRVALSPREQCVCYGFQSHQSTPIYLDAVGDGDCNQNLACISHNMQPNVPTLIPLDGTPCDIDKVCWKKQCIPAPLPFLRRRSPSSRTTVCQF